MREQILAVLSNTAGNLSLRFAQFSPSTVRLRACGSARGNPRTGSGCESELTDGQRDVVTLLHETRYDLPRPVALGFRDLRYTELGGNVFATK